MGVEKDLWNLVNYLESVEVVAGEAVFRNLLAWSLSSSKCRYLLLLCFLAEKGKIVAMCHVHDFMLSTWKCEQKDAIGHAPTVNWEAYLWLMCLFMPGSGKSYLAKMLRDLEVENGGSAPRIYSIDDYFMTEVEKVWNFYIFLMLYMSWLSCFGLLFMALHGFLFVKSFIIFIYFFRLMRMELQSLQLQAKARRLLWKSDGVLLWTWNGGGKALVCMTNRLLFLAMEKLHRKKTRWS